MVATQRDAGMVVFEISNRRLKFTLPLPSRDEFRHVRANQTGTLRERSKDQIESAWEQACRSRWRALLLSIKAKLEAVEVGIALFDNEFLANIVLATGETVGDCVRPQIEQHYLPGTMPNLFLPPPRSN